MTIEVGNVNDMETFGTRLGELLRGGEVIELVGDVGAGKTTLTKSIAIGLGIDEDVQSPSFTISRLYEGRNDLRLAHYDFYRLDNPGLMATELDETARDSYTVTIIEWGEIVRGILPSDRLTITISTPTESSRQLLLKAHGPVSRQLEEQL